MKNMQEDVDGRIPGHMRPLLKIIASTFSDNLGKT